MNKTKLCVYHLVRSKIYKFVGVKLSFHFSKRNGKELLSTGHAGYQNFVLVNELDQIRSTRIRRPWKKHRRKFFIRQLSEKSKTLYFAKNVVTLVERGSYTPNQSDETYDSRYQNFVMPKLRVQKLNGTRINEVYATRTVTSFDKSKIMGGSIFSLDANLNQLLFASNSFYRLSSHHKLGYLYATNLNKMSFLSSDLANLGLSIKTYLLLKQKGIHKIGSLVAYSPKYLLQLLNKDKEMFAEVKRSFLLLAIHGNG